jgi:hypothetical protein
MVCDVFSLGHLFHRHCYASRTLTFASVSDTSRWPIQRILKECGLAKLRRQGLVERFLPDIIQYVASKHCSGNSGKSTSGLSPTYRLYRCFSFFFHPCIYVYEALLCDDVVNQR